MKADADDDAGSTKPLTRIPSLKEVLLGPGPRFEDDFVPPRGNLRFREPLVFDDDPQEKSEDNQGEQK